MACSVSVPDDFTSHPMAQSGTSTFIGLLSCALIGTATPAVALAGSAYQYQLMGGAALHTATAERQTFGKCAAIDGREAFMVVRLQSGQVLVAGGVDSNSEDQPLNQADLCDPSTGILTPVGSMAVARCCASATLLNNGGVLIAGGLEKWQKGWPATRAAEVYDPKTRQFTRVTDMNFAREGHSATLLKDGKVLIAGGEAQFYRGGTVAAELYAPVTRSFTSTGSMLGVRICPRADLLPDGKVLICGGWLPYTGGRMDLESSGCDLYDPSAGRFSFTFATSHLRDN